MYSAGIGSSVRAGSFSSRRRTAERMWTRTVPYDTQRELSISLDSLGLRSATDSQSFPPLKLNAHRLGL